MRHSKKLDSMGEVFLKSDRKNQLKRLTNNRKVFLMRLFSKGRVLYLLFFLV
jgi:hypothetical protein